MGKKKKKQRFEKMISEGTGLSEPLREVWLDKETGVQYLRFTSGYSTSLIPLLGSDGKPLIVKPEENSALSD